MSRTESYSSLATLSACSEKYRLGYVERLEAPGVNLPAHNGTVLHAAFRHLYVNGWTPELLPEALDIVDAEWGDVKAPFGDKKSFLTREHARLRLEMYVEERVASPTILELGDVVSAFVEEMHEFEWWSPDGGIIRLRGIPDLVIAHEGKTYVVDNKFPTSGWLSDYYFLRFSLGYQLRIYAAMYEQKMGVHVDGGIINAVSAAEKSTDPAEKWKTRKSSPSMLRVIDFTPEQVEEAHVWARGLLAQRDAHAASGTWPRNELACDDYGGCEFLPLCLAPNENVRAAKKLTMFRKKERR